MRKRKFVRPPFSFLANGIESQKSTFSLIMASKKVDLRFYETNCFTLLQTCQLIRNTVT